MKKVIKKVMKKVLELKLTFYTYDVNILDVEKIKQSIHSHPDVRGESRFIFF